MERRALQVLQALDQRRPTCQLGKLSKRDCTMICALIHGCPVAYVDSHDFPIIAKRRDIYDK